MSEKTKAYWVGALFLSAVLLLVAFLWLMGTVGPFGNYIRLNLLYDFAGGVEMGSPVRVAGIKVGKVESIVFAPARDDGTLRAAVQVTISVSKDSAKHIREDSKFFINMAGIIGERYLEISPGSSNSPVLADGAYVRGVDPPRIDQLLSQGYGVFGRIQDFITQNETVLTEFIGNLTGLLADANRFLGKGDKKRVGNLIESLVDLFQKENTQKLMSLVENLNYLSRDMKDLTGALKTEEARKAFREFLDLVERAHGIDKPALKRFLQEEGIRARMF